MGLMHTTLEEENLTDAQQAASGRQCVLVVDDEEEIREVLRLTLTLAGYDVREAEDGKRALASVEVDPPDLIILDVLMPGMNGFDVCRQVRGDSHSAHIPILMLSARTDARSKAEGLRAGATAYLTKPLAAEQLIRHVADALDSSLT
jgi:DNA-binding response OmpR family regulator